MVTHTMSPKKYTISKPLLDLRMTLGEGCVWDSRSQRLYFVDIDLNTVYVYDPKQGKYGYSHFDKNVTAIALLAGQEGLVASIEDNFAFIPPSSLPQPLLHSDQPPEEQEALVSAEKQYIVIPTSTVSILPKEARLNEGAVDPAGRFLAGTMGKEFGSHNGRMWSLRPAADGKGWDAPLVYENITCTNGMAWTDGGKKMYFTDSWVKEIVTFDYDIEEGTMSNRRVFSDISATEYGYPDGLCLDDQGGVWTARWSAGKVLRLNPKTAEIDVEIDIPSSWNVTCCIFGGENLDVLYITTARCSQSSDSPPERTELGKLYCIEGLGYRGVERGRFKGTF